MNSKMETAGYEKNTIARVIERNLSEYQVEMGIRLRDTQVQCEENLVCVATTAPFYMYNGVFESRLSAPHVDVTIRRIVSLFKEKNVPFVWQLGPTSQPSDLADDLLKSGLSHYEDEPGMALDLTQWNEDVLELENVEIVRVSTESQLQDWVSVWAFDADDETLVQLHEVHRQFGYGSTCPWTYYVGYENGIPVSTSLLFRGSEAVAVHWVVTLPQVRKRGIGAAMTMTVLSDARVDGYSLAVLTASPDGRGIYERLGFREYCTISKYIWKVR